jgi:hypothetical protein
MASGWCKVWPELAEQAERDAGSHLAYRGCEDCRPGLPGLASFVALSQLLSGLEEVHQRCGWAADDGINEQSRCAERLG